MSGGPDDILPEHEYLELLSALAKLGRGLLQDRQRPPEAGGLILKLAFHAASAHVLFRGFEPGYFGLKAKEGAPTRFFDHATTQALSRMVLETYLTYFHVFQQPSDNVAERELRYCAWRLAALRAEGEWRFAAGTNLPKNWSGAGTALKEILAANVSFCGRDDKERKRILDGKWRRPRLVLIAQQAGLPTAVSGPLYNMLSESMHSGAYAAFGVVQAEPQAQKKLIETDLLLITMIMGRTLHSHFDVLELPQELVDVIEYWTVSWSTEPDSAPEANQ